MCVDLEAWKNRLCMNEACFAVIPKCEAADYRLPWPSFFTIWLQGAFKGPSQMFSGFLPDTRPIHVSMEDPFFIVHHVCMSS